MDKQQSLAPPITIFYSYAHKDERHRQQLENHLSLLRQEGIISEWHDRQIRAGTNWAQEIDKYLNTASVIILLVSADFIASDYCYGVEMQRALKRHKNGEAHIIPIILRPVDWHKSPFAHLQALPKDAKPVTSRSNRDAAWADVALGIRKVIENITTDHAVAAQPLSRNSIDFFLVGCGVGNRVGMLPLPSGSDDGEFNDFIDSLARIGLLSNPEIAPIVDIRDKLAAYHAVLQEEEIKEVILHYFEMMGRFPDLVRNNSSADDFRWFKFGYLLYEVVTTSIIDSRSFFPSLNALESLLNDFELGPSLTRETTNFIARARKTRNKKNLLEMVNQIALTVYLLRQ